MKFDPNRRDLLDMKEHLDKTTVGEVMQVMEKGLAHNDEGMEAMYFAAFTVLRRNNPEITLEEVYELRLSELREVIGTQDPTTDEASKGTG